MMLLCAVESRGSLHLRKRTFVGRQRFDHELESALEINRRCALLGEFLLVVPAPPDEARRQQQHRPSRGHPVPLIGITQYAPVAEPAGFEESFAVDDRTGRTAAKASVAKKFLPPRYLGLELPRIRAL